MSKRETLEKLINKYADLIENNDYVSIMNDKEMESQSLGILLEALNKAGVRPFNTIDKLGDIYWFAKQLRGLKRGWENADFVRGWDPQQAFQWATTEGIAKAAYALGAYVWYTDIGYFGKGSPDYLISWKPMSVLATNENFEIDGWDIQDFKAVQWTDSELYD